MLRDHPYLGAVVRGGQPLGDLEHERVHASYLLVKNPQASALITDNVRRFARDHNINSIVYVPLRIGDRVSYVLVFDAVDKRRFFADEEIEILTFFGKQITQPWRSSGSTTSSTTSRTRPSPWQGLPAGSRRCWSVETPTLGRCSATSTW